MSVVGAISSAPIGIRWSHPGQLGPYCLRIGFDGSGLDWSGSVIGSFSLKTANSSTCYGGLARRQKMGKEVFIFNQQAARLRPFFESSLTVNHPT